jgi:serine/threonine-protein kinase HipA
VPKTLVVLVDGRRVGTVLQGAGGHFGFSYDEGWKDFPLSLSMPLAVPEHGDEVVRAFLWGLLPDSEGVLGKWSRIYHVSSRNPFALLEHVGEDCAGAAQFVPADREAALANRIGGIRPLDDAEIAQRLRLLRRDPTAWHAAQQTGQFSLAGAQAKTALFHSDEAGWADPWGAVPTTHILKPAVLGFDEHDLNEHLCLQAARLLGLAAADTRVASFENERVIVVERYDRVLRPDGTMSRIHQEDLCQALGVMPTSKYQNEGGPSPEDIIALLRPDDVPAFVDGLAFNWLIAGTDAHAKNYSILLDGGEPRLAPLYDVSSALPYDDMYLPRLRMAMKIGGEYSMEGLAGRHWRRFATTNDLDPGPLLARITDLAALLPGGLRAAAEAPEVRALGSDLPEKLVERVERRVALCADRLA